MLKKIVGNNKKEQVEAFVAEAKRMIKKYGWENEVVYPYSFPMKITEIIKMLEHFDERTEESKSVLISLANGLQKALNAWEKHATTPKVLVKTKDGRELRVSEEFADMLIAEDMATLA